MRVECGRARNGFTLLELVSSVTVLLVMASLLFALTSGAEKMVHHAEERAWCDQQAALVYARMDEDFGRMFRRRDVDVFFSKADGADSAGANDRMFFIGESSAYFRGAEGIEARSTAALVGYRCGPSGGLERFGRRLAWDGDTSAGTKASMPFLVYPSRKSQPYTQTTLDGRWPAIAGDGFDADFDMLAPTVARFEFCFLLKDGCVSNAPVIPAPGPARSELAAIRPPSDADDVGRGYLPGSRWYDQNTKRAYIALAAESGGLRWEFAGLEDVQGVVVTMAVMPRGTAMSQALVGDLGKLLGDSPQRDTVDESIESCRSQWIKAVRDARSSSLAREVRIYEKTFPLP